MASNVEGEALKRMSGAASQGGGLSALTGWLAGRGQRGGGDSSGSKKSGIDYQNEETARRYEMERQGTRRDWMKEDIEAHGRTKSMAYGSDGSAKWEAYPSPTGRTNVTASGGKKRTPSGTSGNTKGAQFKRTVGKAAKDVASSVAGAAVAGAAGAITKNPKVAKAAATVGASAANSAIDAVAKRVSGRSSMPSVSEMTPSSSTNTAADLSMSNAKKPRATGKPKA